MQIASKGLDQSHKDPILSGNPNTMSAGYDLKGIWITHVESRDLVLDVVLQQISISLLISSRKLPQSRVEELLIENLTYADTTSSSFCRVRWSDSFSRCANTLAAQFHLFEPVYKLVQVENDVCSVADKNSRPDVFQALINT